MLRTAREKLRAAEPAGSCWLAAAADHRVLPLAADGCGPHRLRLERQLRRHLVSGHLARSSWMPGCARLDACSGRVGISSSLSHWEQATNRLSGLPHLEHFYDWLDEQAFDDTWIRTDYRFESLAQAEQLAGFFFGDEMKSRIQTRARRSRCRSAPACGGSRV